MAAPLEARQKQRAVIEFLVAEGETPLRIPNRLKNVYKDNTIHYGNVKRWVQRFKKSTEDHDGNDNEVKTAVLNWLRHQPAEFYNTGIHALVYRWTVALERGGDYV